MWLKSNRWWSDSEIEFLVKCVDKWMDDSEISFLIETKTEDAVRNKKKRLWLKIRQKAPKIFVFDIETAPINVYTWWLYDQDINIDAIKSDWFILAWSWKWLFDWEIIWHKLNHKEADRQDDKRIVTELWKMIDEADIVVAHNWDKFDIKKMNTRFIYHELPMPSSYRSVDTLKIAKKHFAVSSNKLDYLCKFLWLNTKISTWWFELWLQCLKWNQTALDKMSEYCSNDVRILEELYLKLRPYYDAHPNANMYVDGQLDGWVCSVCSSTNIKKLGTYKTQQWVYNTSRCECWAIIRSNKNEKKSSRVKVAVVCNATKKNKKR